MNTRLRRPRLALLLGLVALLSSLGDAPARPTPGAEANAVPSILANRPVAALPGPASTPDPLHRTPVPAPAPTSTPTQTQSPKRFQEARLQQESMPPMPAPNASTPAAPGGLNQTALDPQHLATGFRMLIPFVFMLLPAALLMFTAFVRINIVLVLLRQALGSPQVPGNQVLTALALLLTALVMRPAGEVVYNQGIEPYLAGKLSGAEAWEAGSKPIKRFMLDQIEQTRHENYLWQLYDLSTPSTANRPDPVSGEDFPFQVVAPAFLLSELTTALTIGFYLYLPFLVIDLVVSSVLASMGLFMLPPTLVAMPLKLILFVLADGWLLVASMLIRSFA